MFEPEEIGRCLATDDSHEGGCHAVVTLNEEIVETHKPKAPAEESIHMKNLREWHISSGGLLDSIFLHEESGEMEMIAHEDIEKGDIVAFIPETMFLTVKGAFENSPIVKRMDHMQITEKLKTPAGVAPLAIYVMEQRRDPESPWKDYLETMPKEFTNHPIFWTEEEMKMLQGSEIVSYVKNFRKKLEADYKLISSNIEDLKEFTEQEFMETFKLVQSRMFGLTNEENAHVVSAMVPIGDNFNHRSKFNVEWGYGNNGLGDSGVIFNALEKIPKGEQIYTSYGTKSNFQLLTQYGFVEKHNHVKQPLFLRHIAVFENDPNKDLKLEFLNKAPHFQLMINENIDAKQTQEALSVLRVIYFDDIENVHKLMGQVDRYNQMKHVAPISNRAELKVLHELIKLCHIRLGEYPRTIQGDVDMLKVEQPPNAMTAI